MPPGARGARRRVPAPAVVAVTEDDDPHWRPFGIVAKVARIGSVAARPHVNLRSGAVLAHGVGGWDRPQREAHGRDVEAAAGRAARRVGGDG
eukprot:6581683-Prymnesium_polylepis.1